MTDILGRISRFYKGVSPILTSNLIKLGAAVGLSYMACQKNHRRAAIAGEFDIAYLFGVVGPANALYILQSYMHDAKKQNAVKSYARVQIAMYCSWVVISYAMMVGVKYLNRQFIDSEELREDIDICIDNFMIYGGPFAFCAPLMWQMNVYDRGCAVFDVISMLVYLAANLIAGHYLNQIESDREFASTLGIVQSGLYFSISVSHFALSFLWPKAEEMEALANADDKPYQPKIDMTKKKEVYCEVMRLGFGMMPSSTFELGAGWARGLVTRELGAQGQVLALALMNAMMNTLLLVCELTLAVGPGFGIMDLVPKLHAQNQAAAIKGVQREITLTSSALSILYGLVFAVGLGPLIGPNLAGGKIDLLDNRGLWAMVYAGVTVIVATRILNFNIRATRNSKYIGFATGASTASYILEPILSYLLIKFAKAGPEAILYSYAFCHIPDLLSKVAQISIYNKNHLKYVSNTGTVNTDEESTHESDRVEAPLIHSLYKDPDYTKSMSTDIVEAWKVPCCGAKPQDQPSIS